jgi:hypothetical protein
MQNQQAAVLYSPLPPEDYSRPCPDLGRAGIGAELSSDEHRAVWNLYFLSDPALDGFISGWETSARVNMKMLAACGKALSQKLDGYTVRELVLVRSPQGFVEHVMRAKHTHLAPYRLAKAKWVETIRARAQLYRGSVKQEGTVVFVNFGQRPTQAVVTSAPESAKIMPLAFPKRTS